MSECLGEQFAHAANSEKVIWIAECKEKSLTWVGVVYMLI